MAVIADLTDAQIEKAWADWEQPDQIRTFLMDWIEMSEPEKFAFFYGMVMPEVFGRARARRETLERIHLLGLHSRYPSRPDQL